MPTLIGIVSEETTCITPSGRGGRIPAGAYPVVPIDGADEKGEVFLEVGGELVAVSNTDPLVTYAEPGTPFRAPDLPPVLVAGFVVGECGHRVAGTEWRAGYRNCERCGSPAPATGPAYRAEK